MLCRNRLWQHISFTDGSPEGFIPLQWRHNERDCVFNRRRFDCLPNRLSRRRSKKTSKLHVTGLCEGNSPATGEFPTQRASNAECVSVWWRHHAHLHDEVMIRKRFPCYCVSGIRRSSVVFTHKGSVMRWYDVFVMLARISCWLNKY